MGYLAYTAVLPAKRQNPWAPCIDFLSYLYLHVCHTLARHILTWRRRVRSLVEQCCDGAVLDSWRCWENATDWPSTPRPRSHSGHPSWTDTFVFCSTCSTHL